MPSLLIYMYFDVVTSSTHTTHYQLHLSFWGEQGQIKWQRQPAPWFVTTELPNLVTVTSNFEGYAILCQLTQLLVLLT